MERLRTILNALVAFLAPGLLLLLLGIQVALGLRGFDQPASGALFVLQVPGILLGWGGVLLLAPLLMWLVLDWWGYEAPGGDMGGLALKALGSAVLGIAAGALFGLAGGTALGGMIGGALAAVLGTALGKVVSVFVLGLMAAPACVLALSLQKRRPAPSTPASTSPVEAAPTDEPEAAASSAGPRLPERGYGFWSHVRGLFRGDRVPVEQRWYPKQRFDAWGNELPMDFKGQRDVGAIRFVGEDEPTVEHEIVADVAAAATTDERPTTIADLLAGEERLPTIPELLAGNYNASLQVGYLDPSGGPRELAGDEAEDGFVHVDGAGRPLDGPLAGSPAGAAPERAASSFSFAPADPVPRRGDDAPLAPGVRYADPEPPEEPEDVDAPEPERARVVEQQLVLSQIVCDAVRGPVIAPRDAAQTRRTIRDTLRARVETIRAESESPDAPPSRYLQKLEALGMFEPTDPWPEDDDAPGPEAPAPRTPQKKQTSTPKKKATPRKTTSKQAAPKKAAPRKVGPKQATAAKAVPKKAATLTARPKKGGPRRPDTQARAHAAMLESLRIERLDPLFSRAVEAALDRGAASPVLLTRRLGLPFARASALLERMTASGVVGAAQPNGASPLLITREEWASV